MSKCEGLVLAGRRQFLRGAGFAVAGTAVAAVAPAPAKAAPPAARVQYPAGRLANIADLEVDVPKDVAYADADSPGVLLKLGTRVEGGAGPDGDVVAFSVLCPHKGFPLNYAKADRTLDCPAYNSEVHATRDMGFGELNNCYEDAELADTIMVVGANPLEAQTNCFLNHWIPNLRGTSIDEKKKEFPGEPVEQGRIVIVDPRRTVTVAACEAEAGADRVLHLAIEPGTDLVLFNGLFTHIVEKGWIDEDFIQASTVAAAAGGTRLIARPGVAVPERDHELTDFAAVVTANRTTLAECARITGLKEADIVRRRNGSPCRRPGKSAGAP